MEEAETLKATTGPAGPMAPPVRTGPVRPDGSLDIPAPDGLPTAAAPDAPAPMQSLPGPADAARFAERAARDDAVGGAEAPASSFIYALGRVEPRFPSLAVEKEFAQVVGRRDTAGASDREAMRDVILQRDNRYLARHLCWVFSIEGLDSYILTPRDPADLDLLIASVRPEPRRDDLDVVIGVRGPIAAPEVCDGLAVPILFFDQVYYFDRDSLIESIPRSESISGRKEQQFVKAAGELFDRFTQLNDNAGATDEHRALNYLAVRYPRIYAAGAEALDRNATLTAVDVRPSRLTGVRMIMDVIFSYTHRETDVTEKSFVRVDVTEEFPFLVTKLSPYYDR